VARIRVVLDACVLLPYQLADLLLRLADAELYEPLWSDEILDEVERNLVEKFGITAHQASRRLGHMRSAFPNATIKDFDNLVDGMTTHPKDRHVAAAAVRGGAALVVTANLKDFPAESLAPYDLVAVHPDEFLQDQLDLDRATTVRCLREQRAAYTWPQFTFTEFYTSLGKTVPDFAKLAALVENDDWDSEDPLPLEIVSSEEAQQAFFPDGPPEPTNPLGAAFLWWTALLSKTELFTALQNLTWHPPAWGDYEWASEMLEGTGLMQFVERCVDDDDIAYVKFMPDVDHPMVAFGEARIANAKVLTLVRCEDGWWRAWGLSDNGYFPPAAEVRGTQPPS